MCRQLDSTRFLSFACKLMNNVLHVMLCWSNTLKQSNKTILKGLRMFLQDDGDDD